MELISIQFLIFITAALLLYYLLPAKYQWMVLLVTSYVYYIIICKLYVGFIITTTLTSYWGARQMGRLAAKRDATLKEMKSVWKKDEKKAYKARMNAKRKFWVLLMVLLNFGILAFLKYTPQFPNFRLLFPLGISFYTFQTMGYVIDVYREQAEPEQNVGKLALFVSFFPQIIQGPIAEYNQLAPQFFKAHRFQYDRLKSGALLVLWGVMKKLIIADRAVQMIRVVQKDMNDFSGAWILASVIMYALQLYADFSGGIDIVRGIAEMFDIDMAINFRQPYFATSLAEYWHRWHITLGAWVRKYVFYPLSISKRFLQMGKKIKSWSWMPEGLSKHLSRVIPACLASLITFLIIGIWHGANWKYVAFGLWNGLVIMAGELLKPVNARLLEKLHIKQTALPHRIASMLWTFVLVLIGYYFDVAANLKEALQMLWRSVSDLRPADLSDLAPIKHSGLDYMDMRLLLISTLILFTISVLQERRSDMTMREWLMQKPLAIQWSLIYAGIFAVLIFGYYGAGVNPAEFVYMQF